MAYLPTSAEQDARRRTGLRVIGVILVLLGIAAVVYGLGQINNTPATPADFTPQMNDATSTGSSFTGIFLLGAGAVGMLAGFTFLMSGYGREKVAGEPGSGLTCGACGLLNEPFSRTCESCGEPLA
jgi:hypothetical protein